MTEKSIPEVAPCPSKTGRATRKTGGKSAVTSSNAPDIAAKAARLIPTAEPETTNPIPSPEAASYSPSPTSITSRKTARQKISGLGAKDATLPMTPDTMLELVEKPARSLTTIVSRHSSSGKNKSEERRKALMEKLRNDETQMTLYQIQLDAYKPAMNAIKLLLEIFGSSSPNLYMSKNKQIAAICQVKGLNDPNASNWQRIAITACLEKLRLEVLRSLELDYDYERIKKQVNDELTRIGDFFGLGNKKAVKARGKAA